MQEPFEEALKTARLSSCCGAADVAVKAHFSSTSVAVARINRFQRITQDDEELLKLHTRQQACVDTNTSCQVANIHWHARASSVQAGKEEDLETSNRTTEDDDCARAAVRLKTIKAIDQKERVES